MSATFKAFYNMKRQATVKCYISVCNTSAKFVFVKQTGRVLKYSSNFFMEKSRG